MMMSKTESEKMDSTIQFKEEPKKGGVPRFTKMYNQEMQLLIFKTSGETVRFLMYLVSSGLVRYGENTFMLNRYVRQRIATEMGLQKGSIYRHLRKLKDIGVIEMLGVGNYLINKSIIEYGQSKQDWK
jgi:hypothetical protein